MKKIFISILSLTYVTILSAAGYKIPENSLNAVALSDANVAYAHGADASYYNPANMVFNKTNKSDLEVDLTYIGLSKIHYKGTTYVNSYGNIPTNTSSEAENFILPSLHYVSPAIKNFRFGLAIISPAGLSKKWKTSPASLYAKEFTVQTAEINPTIAYKINNKLAIALGVRGVYSQGTVTNAYYNLKGTGFNWGYNLALTFKPTKNINIAATYRSRINMNIKGNDTKNNSGVRVVLPIPATYILAISYTYHSDTTFEALIEHNVWSTYKTLQFHFDNTALNSTALGQPQTKNWKDTNTYRFGLTHKYKKTTTMVGFAYDPTPVPNSTIGYELPDSTAKIVSLGERYDLTSNVNIGIAGLVSLKNSRQVNNTVLNGQFNNSKAYLVTLGVEYIF